MPLFKTSNPALSGDAFGGDSSGRPGGISSAQYGGVTTGAMTLSGTINKTGILLLLAVPPQPSPGTSSRPPTTPPPYRLRCWSESSADSSSPWSPSSRREWSPVTAPIYALLEGLFLGGLSALIDLRYPGIAMQAVGLTFGTLFVMLLAYRSGLIPVTDKLRMGIVAATGGIALLYVLEMVLGFFGIHFAAINGCGFIGIAFSLFVVAIAALNLVLDFDFIERGVQYGAPKYMEWYGAFGIIVTLVWLYLEILRLLSKLRSRN